MQSTKLIKLLKCVNSSEIEEFRAFLYSPLHNTREKLRLLGDSILQYAPSFDDKQLTKSNVGKAIFGKKTFSTTAFNNLISDTLQLLYDFLAYQQLKQQPFLQKELLIQNLLQRNANQDAEKQLIKFQKQLEEYPFQNTSFHQHQFAFFEKKDQLFLRKTRRGYDQNLQEMSFHFNRYYLSQSIQMACKMASRNVVIHARYDYRFFEKNMLFLEQEKQLSFSPSSQIFWKLFQLITKEDADYIYRKLHPLLEQHAAALSPTELTDIYSYIVNYCVRQINLGKTTFNGELFQWYKLLLKDEILLENKQLSEKNYTNIVTVSLRSKAYTWAENFIYSYQNHLQSSVRENAVAYNLASLFFEKKEYNKALVQLFDVTFTDNFYHILSNTIQLKSYFHLGETEAYLALIQALKQYIQRNKDLSTYHKNANLNFLKMSKQIYQFQLSKDLVPKHIWVKKQENLRIKLLQTTPITNKEWLKEMLDNFSFLNRN